MKFIARKYNRKLYPECEEHLRQAEMAEGFMIDLRIVWCWDLCYHDDFAKLKDDFERDIPNKFRGLEEVLGKREWVATKMSYVDFPIAETMDAYETLFPGCFDQLPNCKKYWANFFNLPAIRKYRDSPRFKKFPINNPGATWGAKSQP